MRVFLELEDGCSYGVEMDKIPDVGESVTLWDTKFAARDDVLDSTVKRHGDKFIVAERVWSLVRDWGGTWMPDVVLKLKQQIE